MKKKICLITGGTEGVGKATVTELAKIGFVVVFVARNTLKAEAVKKEILLSLPQATIDYIITDLTSLKQVQRLVEVFKERYDHLDVLINNAGIFAQHRILTEDGYESSYQVNYLAPFILTDLLMDELKKSSQARIINLSASAFTMGKFDPQNLQSEKNFSVMTTYATSKLLILMFTIELAERLQGTGITVNAVHPGVVKTQMMQSLTGLFKLMSYLISPFAMTPKKGAATSVYLATSDDVKSISAKYFAKSKVEKVKSKFFTKENRKLLWDISMRSLEKSS
jgi:retinol dehydrogenase-12